MRVLLTVALLAIAGCAEPPVTEPHAAAAEPPLEDASTSQPLNEGPSPPGSFVPATSEPRNRTVMLEHEGSTEGEACPAVGPVERCVATAAAVGSPFDIPVVERPTLLDLTIELDEPRHAPACAWAVLRVREGDTWRSLGDEGKIAMGGSPLTASWGLGAYPASSAFHVAVYCGGETFDGPLRAYSGWAAPFRLSGVLHHLSGS